MNAVAQVVDTVVGCSCLERFPSSATCTRQEVRTPPTSVGQDKRGGLVAVKKGSDAPRLTVVGGGERPIGGTGLWASVTDGSSVIAVGGPSPAPSRRKR